MTQGEAEAQYQVSAGTNNNSQSLTSGSELVTMDVNSFITPLSLRRDETALHARIVEVELECVRLRNRVKQLERALELVRPEES